MPGNHKKPLIVFVSHWAEKLGGAEYSLIDLAEALSSKAELHLITTENGPLVTIMQKKNIYCHIVPSYPQLHNIKRNRLITNVLTNLPALLSYLRHCNSVHSLLVRLCPDCIHANVPKSHFTLFILRICGIRYRGIIHFREIFPSNSIAYHLYRIFFLLARRPDVIAISEAVRISLPKRVRYNAVLIYNGVSVNLHHIHKKRPHLPIRFLFLGRVVPWKGCDFLIDAFQIVLSSRGMHCASLSLIGDTSYWDPEYRNTLFKKITCNNLSEYIQLFPHTTSPEQAFSLHDVLCAPSLNEPFGRVVAEAQGAGLPVIAWQSGGPSEIVLDGETGILTPIRNINAFVTAMELFIDNPSTIISMGKKGRKRTALHFNRTKQLLLLENYLLGNT